MDTSRKIKDLQIKKGHLYHMGVHMLQNGLSVVSDVEGEKEQGIILFLKHERVKIPFLPEDKTGALYCIMVENIREESFQYCFYRDGERFLDPYVPLTNASKKFGVVKKEQLLGVIRPDTFDWGEDKPLGISYSDSIIYKLHVRGFTKHASSNVSGRGTFLGLKEKISYLKELGVTAVECMPVYEFEDVITNPAYTKMDEKLAPFMDETQKTWETKVNYWGFSKAYYFAPKNAYAHSEYADLECKDMIKALHENGLEFIMKLYFDEKVRPGFVLDVCRFWVEKYHVDGFRLMGKAIPVELLTTDPFLRCTKLIFEHDISPEYVKSSEQISHNLALSNDAFRYDVRKFLKSDEDMLIKVAELFKRNPREYAVINEITTYQGFSLYDLVSYDRKHNEANGEDNRDGSEYNYSWNCGFEGKTRKKQIVQLRKKQIRNAFMMLLFSQGTPAILAGDEFAHTCDGNNNPYCQDNKTNWLNWDRLSREKEQFLFVKEMIALRRNHPILHMDSELRQMDYMSCGYPDLSYHGEMAWYPQLQNYNRHFGIMYCGKYAVRAGKEDDFFFVAYNTHWMVHVFALPKLPKEMEWSVVMDTQEPDVKKELVYDKEKKQYQIAVEARSVVLLTGKKTKKE